MPYRNIRHGDIVVFLSPSERGLFVVKRIIGIPGDRIHLRGGVVYRNGQKLDEPYTRYKDDPSSELTRPYRENFPAVLPDMYTSRRSGKLNCRATSRVTTLLYLRITTSPWATTATSVMTAASGDSFHRKT